MYTTISIILRVLLQNIDLRFEPQLSIDDFSKCAVVYYCSRGLLCIRFIQYCTLKQTTRRVQMPVNARPVDPTAASSVARQCL